MKALWSAAACRRFAPAELAPPRSAPRKHAKPGPAAAKVWGSIPSQPRRGPPCSSPKPGSPPTAGTPCKSTGPRTPEGKEKSRANALKHGLCSSVVVPEDAAAVQGRAMAYWRTLRPQNEFHSWLVDQIAVLTLRVDRCERIERRLRDKVSLRRVDLGGGPSGRGGGPRRADRPEAGGGRRGSEEDPARLRVADGSLGLARPRRRSSKGRGPRIRPNRLRPAGHPRRVPRGARPGASIDLEGRVIEEAVDPSGVARREIADLQARRDLASEMDEVDGSLAGPTCPTGSTSTCGGSAATRGACIAGSGGAWRCSSSSLPTRPPAPTSSPGGPRPPSPPPRPRPRLRRSRPSSGRRPRPTRRST